MTHIWHWILDFVGVNNTYNTFSTHMYNFWSGFGGGIIQFSLLGALVAMYRRYSAHIKTFETTIRKPLDKIEEHIVETKKHQP
jgi:uncharacterized membrane protein YbhN (UPF0104 family)